MEGIKRDKRKASVVQVLVTDGIDLDVDLGEIPLCETIGAIKARFAAKVPKWTDIGPPVDPEEFALQWLDKVWEERNMTDDDTQSLEDYLYDAGYFSNPKSHVKLLITPEWERYVVDGDFTCDLDQVRPKNLPDNTNILRVEGKLHVEACLDNGEIKRRRVGYLGGLLYDLKLVHNLITTAKHVVLLFSDTSLVAAQSYACHLLPSNPHDQILGLLVTWDKFSYLFLRMLRKCVGPQVPFLALTDCNVNHLDLLTFLDTPPADLARLYGDSWDLSTDCADVGVDGHDVVDIKWLGLRPSEIESYVDPGCRHTGKIGPGFDDVCNFLQTHPRFLMNKDWLAELERFKTLRSSLDLMSIRSLSKPDLTVSLADRANFVGKEYLPPKLAKEEWI